MIQWLILCTLNDAVSIPELGTKIPRVTQNSLDKQKTLRQKIYFYLLVYVERSPEDTQEPNNGCLFGGSETTGDKGERETFIIFSLVLID